MPGTSSISGIVSGLDTHNIVDKLIELESYPLKLLESKREVEEKKKEVWRSIQAKLLNLKLQSYSLGRPEIYKEKKVTSSDESVLTASADTSASIGNYTLSVKQIAKAHQMISTGFVDPDSTVGTGTLTIKMGGYVDKNTPVAFLNGQSGISRGSIKITDKAGNSAVIDLSKVITVKDVIDAINENNVVQVKASVEGDSLVLEDVSGGTGSLVVEEVSGGSTAQSLGILGSTTGTTLTGSDINNISSTTGLNLLNENTGIRRYASGDDIRITARDGTVFDVDIGDASTVQDVIDAINNAVGNGGKIVASIGADGDRLILTDTTAGTGAIIVQSLNDSHTAEDLGIAKSISASTLTGDALIAGLNDVLLSRFNGGSGVSKGQFIIQDKAGNIATIDISSDETLQDVLDTINSNTLISVKAEINSDKTGIRLVDTSGGTGSLIVSEAGGTTAEDLGILGSSTSTVLEGQDVHLQFMSRYTRLDSLNGGTGVRYGKIKITDRSGSSVSIDLSSKDTIKTIGDVIDAINNASGVNVLARINDTGDGIEVVDLTGDEDSPLKIEDVGAGYMAKDLNIYGNTSAEQQEHGRDLAYITGTTPLTKLNDGLGVAAGYIKITDRAGNSATIDLTTATTVQDVLDAINNNLTINVVATIDATGNAIDLVDQSNGAGIFMVEEQGSTTAQDLGILQASGINSSTIEGKNILSPVNDRELDFLNGLSGVSGSWFTITNSAGYTATIDITSAHSLQDVLSIINNNTALQVKASVGSDGLRITLTDNSGGTGTLTVADGDGAAASLGLNVVASAGVITGNQILYLTSTTPIQVVGDGKGVDNAVGLDDFQITAKDGSVIGVDIDGVSTLQGIVDAINTDADNTGQITAALSSDGMSIILTDNTGGLGTLSVISLNGTTTAEDLGIAKSTTGTSITGDELVSVLGDRLLDAINDFGGVTDGSFTITDRSGAVATISVTSADRSLKDIVDKINSSGIGVEARVGEDGKGIVIKDTTGKEGKLIIEDNLTSQSLGINNATGVKNTGYDGKFSWDVSIDSTDTLSDIADKINNIDVSNRFSAFVLNDGTGVNPYKLVVNSKYTGSKGKLVIESSLDDLDFSTALAPQDSLVLIGGDGGTPIVSSSNKIEDAIQGLTLNLISPSKDPVSISITQNTEEALNAVKNFIDTYNDLVDYIGQQMAYNPETKEAGILLGNVSLMDLQNELFSMVTDVVDGLPSTMNHISAVGISFKENGHLQLDETTFIQKLAEEPDAVKNLFSYQVNMALGDNGGVASASSTATGYDPSRVINGNTNADEFGPNSNGWMNAVQNENNAWLEVDFARQIALYEIKIHALAETGKHLSGYTLQYWYNNKWNDYRVVSGNTRDEIIHFFTLPYYTNKIRLSNLEGEDGYARVVEVEANEARGVGLRINGRLSYLTDPEVGVIANEIDNIDSNIRVYDYQIKNMQERLDKRRTYLNRQFTRMEELLGQMSSVSSWLASQSQGVSIVK